MSIFGHATDGPPHAYYLGGTEVARLDEGAGQRWFALLRYPDRAEPVRRPCTSYESGRAGVELWVARHHDALLLAAERKHLRWLSHQTWRGSDRDAAARRLAELEQRGA
ncbi:hypothetical protein CSC66_08875 [Pseudoxanthomonas kaohsiungensis]|nr:hypothetical protein CSC66_08875 [Pseudoxanthomonas kaohsiungensis]